MAEVKFRDGDRVIPDYMSDLMAGLDTKKMTYAEAVAEMNNRPARDFIAKEVDKMLNDHFRVR